MVNELKIGNFSINIAAPKTKPQEAMVTNEKSAEKKPADITISNHLDKIICSIMSEANSTDENPRVEEMKHKIQNNDYVVDLDTLSGKLMKSHLLSDV